MTETESHKVAALEKTYCAFVLFLVAVFGACASAQTSGPSPAFARAQHLRHGINLSEWFAQVWDKRGYTREHFESWTTTEDIALIKSMGFDHVRLSVNPQPMFTMNQPQKLPPEYVGYLDAAVKMLLDQGLVVAIDVHPEGDFKQRLSKEDSFVEQFADFWRAVAQHYSTWDPDRALSRNYERTRV
jgi:beta-glucosidase/6-phospho-beta-glucosidase/beta-galactosidase